MKSQIYIGSINWMLMIAVVVIMLVFQKSENLAAAYGLAVTGSMSITGIMMILILSRTTKAWKAVFAALITVVDLVFFTACLHKTAHGRLLVYHSGLGAVYHTDAFVWTRGSVPCTAPCVRLSWIPLRWPTSRSTPRGATSPAPACFL